MILYDEFHQISASAEEAEFYNYDTMMENTVIDGKVPLNALFHFFKDRSGHNCYAVNSVERENDVRKFKNRCRDKLRFFIEVTDHSYVSYRFVPSLGPKSDRWDSSWIGVCCVSRTDFKRYLKVNKLPAAEFTEDNVLESLNSTTARALDAFYNGEFFIASAVNELDDDQIDGSTLFLDEDAALQDAVQMCQDYWGIKPQYQDSDFELSYRLKAS